MECERQACLNTSSGHNFARSVSLTIVLVPNCLIKITLILYWNMSDITKYLCHLNKSSQPCSHICQHGQDGISVLLLLHISNETLILRAILGSNSTHTVACWIFPWHMFPKFWVTHSSPWNAQVELSPLLQNPWSWNTNGKSLSKWLHSMLW